MIARDREDRRMGSDYSMDIGLLFFQGDNKNDPGLEIGGVPTTF